MSKHTPGPWFAVKNTRYWDIVLKNEPHQVGLASVIVTPRSDRYQDDDIEIEANARLIAAAPDLLAALENTLQFAEACHRMTEDKYMRIAIGNDIMKARAAIAKATGGA
jgi:hypothetical protein